MAYWRMNNAYWMEGSTYAYFALSNAYTVPVYCTTSYKLYSYCVRTYSYMNTLNTSSLHTVQNAEIHYKQYFQYLFVRIMKLEFITVI